MELAEQLELSPLLELQDLEGDTPPELELPPPLHLALEERCFREPDRLLWQLDNIPEEDEAPPQEAESAPGEAPEAEPAEEADPALTLEQRETAEAMQDSTSEQPALEWHPCETEEEPEALPGPPEAEAEEEMPPAPPLEQEPEALPDPPEEEEEETPPASPLEEALPPPAPAETESGCGPAPAATGEETREAPATPPNSPLEEPPPPQAFELAAETPEGSEEVLRVLEELVDRVVQSRPVLEYDPPSAGGCATWTDTDSLLARAEPSVGKPDCAVLSKAARAVRAGPRRRGGGAPALLHM